MSKVIVNKSKFFGYLFSAESTEELNEAIGFVRDERHKAVHVCHGGIVDCEDFFKNDSEVGNPGRILLRILKNCGFNNYVLVVARYYGGIKLGPAGVGKAFRRAGMECFL